MSKRIVDLSIALIGLAVSAPVTLLVMILIWLQDFHSPLYMSQRVGKNGRQFRLIKLRSMVGDADKTQVDTTTRRDPRITPFGFFIRATKLDELPQLWNVLVGDMSVVGPRPNVKRETDLYTNLEQRLLSVKPGITDMASIVFSNLGELLADSKNPNLDYNQLIRPWKSRLGLMYVENQSLRLDIELILLTVVSLFSRTTAASGVARILKSIGASEEVRQVALGELKLFPSPPPGATHVVLSRKPVMHPD